MGITGHILQHALCLAEQLCDVLYAAGESRTDMSLLLRQKLCLIISGRIVPVKEHLRLFKDCEIVEIALVFYDCLAKIRKQRGTDIAQVRSRRRRQSQDAFCALQNRIHKYIVHPGIGINLLHAAADRQILLNSSQQILVFLVDGSLKGGGEGSRLKIIITVQSGYLFHHVVLDGNIAGGTPGGRGHMHVIAADFHVKAQQLQLLLNHFV